MIAVDLSGKSILITGALGAIAEFLNRRLIEAGATLILTDIVAPDEAIARLEGWHLPRSQWRYVPMDVTRPEDVGASVQSSFEASPGLDIAVGHAGGCALHPFAKTPREEYDRILDFDFRGQVHFARAVLREWLSPDIPGHLIFNSSLVGNLPWPELTAYAPVKAALEMFAKCLALEFAGQGMRFNCLAPGHVAAGSSQEVYATDETFRAMVNRAIPLVRRVRPESIADALLWLCSILAQDVDGQVIRVDCGAGIPNVG